MSGQERRTLIIGKRVKCTHSHVHSKAQKHVPPLPILAVFCHPTLALVVTALSLVHGPGLVPGPTPTNECIHTYIHNGHTNVQSLDMSITTCGYSNRRGPSTLSSQCSPQEIVSRSSRLLAM